MKPIETLFSAAGIAIGLLLLSCASPSSPSRTPPPAESRTLEKEAGENSEQAVNSGSVRIEQVSSADLASSDLARISRNLGVNITSGANSVYTVGDVRVRVNWLVPEKQEDLLQLFRWLFEEAGSVNGVLLGEDRVYEVISEDPWAAEMVRPELELAPLQDAKLTPFTVFGFGTMVSDTVAGRDSLGELSREIGVRLAALINQRVDIDGESVRVNFLLPAPDVSAGEVLDAVADEKGSDKGLFIRNGAVVEIVGSDDALETLSSRLSGAPPSPARPCTFRVRFAAAPVANENYMKQNELSLAADRGAGERELRRIDRTLEFGNALPFFLNGGTTEIEFGNEIEMVDDSIAVGLAESEASGEMVRVEVTMTVRTGRPLTSGPSDVGPYTEATDRWPSNDRAVRRIVDEALEQLDRDASDREKVEALHRWVTVNIQYGGEVVGSRYGVEQVLEQGYGRCWDLSDVFITLARAAGIPARQIGGWLYGSEGHIWSQVWLDDEGVWLDVDATADRTGGNSFYIPIWGTRDGEMMFLYLDMPNIESL